MPDAPVNEEFPEKVPSSSETGMEEFILSCDQHQDSKSNISIHIDALSFKSPVKSSTRVSSNVRKIKLKKKQPRKELDSKQAVQDEIEVKNLLNDLLDRVEKEESQPQNLVFSTLGTSHEATDQDQDANDEDDDNISAYLESSTDHSREHSPEKTPSPFKDFDNSNLEPSHNFNEFCDEVNSVEDDNIEDIPDVPETGKTIKLRMCKVDIERRKLDEDEMRIAKECIDSRRVSKQKVNSQRVIVRSAKRRQNSRRENKSTCSKLREKLRKKRILAKSKLRKSKRCFECDSCKKPDCRKCLMCKDMKKYGGRGLKKQSCMARPPCLFLENNKGTLKAIPAQRIKEIRNESWTKESPSQTKPPAKMLKKASVVKELKSIRKPLSRSSSLEILQVKNSSAKEKEPKAGSSKVVDKGLKEMKKRKANQLSDLSRSTLSTRREKLQKFAMVNSDDVMIRQNKIEEIRRKFKQQEEKALATNGKISSMMDLSREELLFGFYL